MKDDTTPLAPDALAHFNDSAAISTYADKTRRLVPGWTDLQTMTALLIAERVRERAEILVVGAGGGAELSVFAKLQPAWRFIGVDPSAPMLDLARTALGPLMERTTLHHGYIDTAPEGPFDAATCLLTLHFVEKGDRARTLAGIRHRLKPGAPFVTAHLSFPQTAAEKDLWLSRYAAFAIASGVDPDSARNAAKAIGERLPVHSPDEEETDLKGAGFHEPTLFYAGLAFRGWVAYA